jgi:hypothetical protein
MSEQDPFRDIDDELDRLDNSFPRYNFIYSDGEREALRKATVDLRERLMTRWNQSASQWCHVDGHDVFVRHREEALRILADIDRMQLDIAITNRPF